MYIIYKHTNIMNQNYIKEFCYRVKNDGFIIIKGNHIYKLKAIKDLTVDLQYDSNIDGFLDNNKNVYLYKKSPSF